MFVPDRLVADIPEELIINLATPAIVACRSVPSPPNPVVELPRCGINAGVVEDEAPEEIEGVVLSIEFITNPEDHELHVTDDGVIAWKSQAPLAVLMLVHSANTAPHAGMTYCEAEAAFTIVRL